MKQGVVVPAKTTSLAELGNVLKKVRNSKKYADLNMLREKQLRVIQDWVTDNKRQKNDVHDALTMIIKHTKMLKENNQLDPGSIIYAIFAYIDKFGVSKPFSHGLFNSHYYREYYHEIDDQQADCNILRHNDDVLIELPNTYI